MTVSVAGTTAIAGTDFTAVEPLTVTILAGQTSTSTTFTFTPTPDEREGEETLTVSGTASSRTARAHPHRRRHGVDRVHWLDTVSVGEGDGATEVTVTASLDMGARTDRHRSDGVGGGHHRIAGTDFTAV